MFDKEHYSLNVYYLVDIVCCLYVGAKRCAQFSEIVEQFRNSEAIFFCHHGNTRY